MSFSIQKLIMHYKTRAFVFCFLGQSNLVYILLARYDVDPLFTNIIMLGIIQDYFTSLKLNTDGKKRKRKNIGK